MLLPVCAAGMTGWTGSALAAGIPGEADLAPARAAKAAGQDVSTILQREPVGLAVKAA